jgi:hypothetical protein
MLNLKESMYVKYVQYNKDHNLGLDVLNKPLLFTECNLHHQEALLDDWHSDKVSRICEDDKCRAC